MTTMTRRNTRRSSSTFSWRGSPPSSARPSRTQRSSTTAAFALLLLESSSFKLSRNDSDEGAAKMLLELKHQFDILEADADWDGYRVLVIADRGKPTPELVDRLRIYLRTGGKLLLSNEALL